MAVDKSKALETMKENLLKYKDAVVIVGNDVVREAHLFHATENNEQAYSRRNMVKNPKEYWSLYKMNIAENSRNKTGTKEQKALLELLELGIVKTVIDVNFDGYLKCNKKIPYDNSITGEKVLVHSDLEDTDCSGKVQPTVPHYNSKVPRETWNNILYSIFDEESLKNNKYVPNTHALILVGVDIGEDIVGDIIDTYKVSRGKNNLQHLLIAVTYKSPQLVDMLEAEFGTADEIDESLLRLKQLLEK